MTYQAGSPDQSRHSTTLDALFAACEGILRMVHTIGLSGDMGVVPRYGRTLLHLGKQQQRQNTMSLGPP